MDRPTDADDKRNDEPTNRNDTVTDSTVSRRSYLKLGGAAALAALGANTANSVSAASYDTITLDAGEQRQVTLGDNDTFENVLIDQRADGAAFSISADGDGWVVRNVGFLGAGDWDNFNFHMRVSCPSGGSGLVENVYANNKGSPNEPMGFLWERGGHEGTIVMRHTYVEGFGNNAGYCTNSNKRGRSGGTVTYEKCYHVDNTPANFRPGGDGSLIKDCVSVIDDPNHDRAYYTNGSSDKARGTWPCHTRGIRMENVQFYTNTDDVNPGAYFSLRHESISNDSICAVEAVDCAGNLSQSDSLFENHEGNTDLTVQNYQQGSHTVTALGSGVPTSAEMAASGSRELPSELPGSNYDGSDSTDDTTDSGSTLDRTLTIDGSDAGETSYEFTVSGDIEDNPEIGSLGSGDTIDGSTASGFVNGGIDGYVFSGDISSATVDGDATILVDGQEVNFNTDSGSTLDRTLTIDGTNTGRTDYEFTVSGDIENDPDTSFGDEDSISGSTATGYVDDGIDGYVFSGELSSATVDGDATILVDGQEVDLSTDSGSTLDRTLTIDGSDAGETSYEFTVSGDIEDNPDLGSLGSGDTIDGSTASGFVNGGIDGYVFSGDITDATVDGDATILVDGSALDLGQFESAPVIDRYEVSEAGSKNRAANIVAEWDVSDVDADLNEVTVDVVDESGSTVDSETTSISGDVAYGVDYFVIGGVDGETFDVTVTVTDGAGRTASATQTVQE